MKYSKIKKYKYRLEEWITYDLPFDFMDVENEWIYLRKNSIDIRRGYCWDGASGPTLDTRNTMNASLVHDCLYQLMKIGLLHLSFRESADKVLKYYLIKDGMSKLRAEMWYRNVRWFGDNALKLGEEPEIKEV